MIRSLSDELVAILTREARVDPTRLDEAVHRQVLNGGGLDTVLLEMGLVDESELAPLLARAASLPLVEHTRLQKIDPALLSMFPKRVAERDRMIPFEITGRRLSVAVATLPKLEDLDRIGFMLSVWIRPFVTTEVRLAQALKRAYEIPIPRRLEGLLGLLGDDVEDESRPSAAAPIVAAPSETPPPRPRARDDKKVARPEEAERRAASEARAESAADTSKRAPIVAPVTPAPALSSTTSALSSTTSALSSTTSDRAAPAAWEVAKTARQDPVAASIVVEPARPAGDLLLARSEGEPAAPALDVAARAALLEQHVDERDRAADASKRARLEERVRWTVDDAIAELAMADDRDAIVDVVLRFAHRRLSTVVMFVVSNRGAISRFEGWDAIDPVWSFRDMDTLHISTTGDHVLAKLHDMKSPFLGPLDAKDPLAIALGRTPRAAVLVPVFIGDRLAAVLYGDCGKDSIPPSALAELHMVVPRFGNALRNLIVRHKRAATGKPEKLDDALRVSPAAEITGAIPVIELDDEDFDEVSDEIDTDIVVAEPMDATDFALENMRTASEGSFTVPPLPKDAVETEARPSERPPPLPRREKPPPLPPRAARPVLAPPVSPVVDDAEVTDRHPSPANGAAVVVTGSGAVVSLDEPAARASEADADTSFDDGRDSATPLPPELVPAELADFDDETSDPEDDISTDEGSRLADLRRRAGAQIAEDVARLPSTESTTAPTTPPPAAARPSTPDDETPVAAAIDDDESLEDEEPVVAPDDFEVPRGAPVLATVDETTERVARTSAPTLAAGTVSVEDAPSTAAAQASTVDEERRDVRTGEPTHGASSASAPASAVVDDAPRADALREPDTRELGEFTDLADDTRQPVPSPGAEAREALLLATHREWMNHVDDEVDALLLGLQATGEANRAAVAKISSLGDRAMPALARYFPGTLTEHPFGVMSARPDPRELSDALACLLRLGVERAAPILVAEVTHEDRLHRYVAVLGLVELHVPTALPRLAERVFDPEFRIALLALEALPHYRALASYPRVVAQLRDLIRRGDDFQRRRAIVAAAELKDREAIPTLADMLGTRPKDISDDAHKALVEITKRDLGTSTRKWRAWFDENAKVHRMEWLLQGLLQKETEIRRSAQTELNQLTGKYFGYRYDAPRNERDNAVLVWQRWWTEEADQSAWP